MNAMLREVERIRIQILNNAIKVDLWNSINFDESKLVCLRILLIRVSFRNQRNF